ncbi:MAG: HDOD domain-containing protein [Sulfuricella sp.]|nr:HDOD domain-containing protein [Sulfuricella sp.]
MTALIPAEAAEKVINSIKIPPRPTVIGELLRERSRPNPDMRKIAQLIAKDIALSAAMLKTVNSPYFGLRSKIDSPQQAVMVLGLGNVANVITALSLKSAIGKQVRLERFWDSAERVAEICAFIAGRMPDISRDMAYMFGLFHDCGIPLLMQKFPDYLDALKLANAESVRSFTDIEDERYATNHATLGYLLARSWALADDICEAILSHHDLSVLTSPDALPGATRGLIAVVRVAEHIADADRMRDDPSWGRTGHLAMEHLGLSEEEVGDIYDDVVRQRRAE